MSSAISGDIQEVSAPFVTECYFTALLIFDFEHHFSDLFAFLSHTNTMALWKCIALLCPFLFFSQICSMPTKCTMRRGLVKTTHSLLENMVSDSFGCYSFLYLFYILNYILTYVVSFLIGRSFSSWMLKRKRQNNLPDICTAIKWLQSGITHQDQSFQAY